MRNLMMLKRKEEWRDDYNGVTSHLWRNNGYVTFEETRVKWKTIFIVSTTSRGTNPKISKIERSTSKPENDLLEGGGIGFMTLRNPKPKLATREEIVIKEGPTNIKGLKFVVLYDIEILLTETKKNRRCGLSMKIDEWTGKVILYIIRTNRERIEILSNIYNSKLSLVRYILRKKNSGMK